MVGFLKFKIILLFGEIKSFCLSKFDLYVLVYMGFKLIIFFFKLLYIFCLVIELEVKLFGLFDKIIIIIIILLSFYDVIGLDLLMNLEIKYSS